MLNELFTTTERMERIGEMRNISTLAGFTMASLFYEPSTRTRLSFESAMLRLGGNVIGTENAREFSSAAKGESLEHTIRVVGGYANVIALRHYQAGAAKRAAGVSPVPVINAGDGAGQHPTQALLDLYTIRRELGVIDGISVAMVGDLANGRTTRSLAYLLAKFSVGRIYFVAPPSVRMGDDIKHHLDEHRVRWEESDDLHAVARAANVIYATRIQQERFGDRIDDYREACGKFVIDGALLAAMPDKTIIMHPLPINRENDGVPEIAPEVDDDPRAAYFRQARNGLYVRMALLSHILER